MAFMGYYSPGLLRVISAGIVGFCRWLANTNFVTRRIDKWLESTEKNDSNKGDDNPSSPSVTTALRTTKTTAESREALLRTIFETFRQGTAPMVRESQLLTWESWDLPLDEVQYNKIIIWHGVEDQQSPIRMIRYMAQHLPHCELREFEGESHFTLVKHLGPILEELVPSEEGGRQQPQQQQQTGELKKDV